MIFSRFFFFKLELFFKPKIPHFLGPNSRFSNFTKKVKLYWVETLKLQEMKFIGTEKEQSFCRLELFLSWVQKLHFFLNFKMTLNPRNKGRKSCINTRLTRSTLSCTKAYNPHLVPRRIWSWPVHQWSSRITITAILTWKIKRIWDFLNPKIWIFNFDIFHQFLSY